MSPHDHFELGLELDPHERRKVRAHIDQIDAAAFDANRQVLARSIGRIDVHTFERLGAACAQARAHWVSAALHMTEKSVTPADAEIARLAALRGAYNELTEVYEALRRMVERGYLCYLDRA